MSLSDLVNANFATKDSTGAVIRTEHSPFQVNKNRWSLLFAQWMFCSELLTQPNVCIVSFVFVVFGTMHYLHAVYQT